MTEALESRSVQGGSEGPTSLHRCRACGKASANQAEGICRPCWLKLQRADRQATAWALADVRAAERTRAA